MVAKGRSLSWVAWLVRGFIRRLLRATTWRWVLKRKEAKPSLDFASFVSASEQAEELSSPALALEDLGQVLFASLVEIQFVIGELHAGHLPVDDALPTVVGRDHQPGVAYPDDGVTVLR